MMHAVLTLIGLVLVLLTLPLALELFLVTCGALLFYDNDDFLLVPTAPLRLVVIIAAHNEEQLIASTVASVRASAAQRIFVVAHNCTDATARIAHEAGAEVSEFNGPSGKGHALLHAFTTLRPTADAYLILDADTTIAPDLYGLVAAALGKHRAVQCRYEATPAAGPHAQLAALAFRAINVVRPRGRQQLGLSCGILGNGFALRAEVFDQLPYNAYSIVEDIELHLALVNAGIRVRFLDHARIYGQIAGSREQHARWEGGRLHLAMQQLRILLRRILGGKLRLIEPTLDLSTLPLAQGTILLLLALALPAVWLRLYALCALAVLATHVAAALLLAPDVSATLTALLFSPLYILRKVPGFLTTLRSSKRDAPWKRAERDNHPDNKS
jgi:hypothetical protein